MEVEIFIDVIIMFSLSCSQHYYLYFIDGTVYTLYRFYIEDRTLFRLYKVALEDELRPEINDVKNLKIRLGMGCNDSINIFQ